MFQSNWQLKVHIEEGGIRDTGKEFQTIRNKFCRYFQNGECWRQDQCKYIHDESKKLERKSIPPCRNGLQCSFLARGVCHFYHRNVGVQNRNGYQDFNHKIYTQKSPQNNTDFTRPWCKFLEDCVRTPNCSFKHYDEVFPKLQRINTPPWHKTQSMLEEY